MSITAAALNTALGYDGNPMAAHVVMQFNGEGGASQYWLIAGGPVYQGRTRMVTTTASDNAATQATAVTTALLAGPA